MVEIWGFLTVMTPLFELATLEGWGSPCLPSFDMSKSMYRESREIFEEYGKYSSYALDVDETLFLEEFCGPRKTQVVRRSQ